MLRALGCPRVALLSNNPDKARQLGRFGVTVTERVPHRGAPVRRERPLPGDQGPPGRPHAGRPASQRAEIVSAGPGQDQQVGVVDGDRELAGARLRQASAA